MPSDDMLVELEEQLMGDGKSSPDRGSQSRDPAESELATKFAGAMKMGRQGGLDVTDDWDPSQDAELAQEYGRVLEHAATAGFSEMDVPVVNAHAIATRPIDPPLVGEPMLDPMGQARELARQTHEQVRASTERVEQAAAGGTYAPPRALPSTTGPATQTFAATVAETTMHGFEPQAITGSSTAATSVEHALRTDLAMPRTTDSQLADALGAAIDVIDLKDIAALRSAVNATRRSTDTDGSRDRARAVIQDLDAQLEPITSRLLDVGVDQELVDTLVDTAIRHRLPFGGEQHIPTLLRTIVEETIDVRAGFPMLDRAHRAAFVGPANSGRTSTIAKLAARYAQTGMRVGILSLVIAEPGVPIVADRRFDDLDAMVRYAGTPAQALDAVDAFDDVDVMLVDTPGSTYLDADTFAQVQSCLLAIGVDDVHVVLPLATSSREARSIVDTFRQLGANRLVVTRIDESRYVGELLNLCFRLGLPMTYLSEGQRVPDDLRAANAHEIADRILKP
jgi:flagellar biosynthesis GTPase FlhF